MGTHYSDYCNQWILNIKNMPYLLFYPYYWSMKFNHIKMQDNGIAEILLFDIIGRGNSTGANIAQEVQFLVDFSGVTEILVRINSEGGDMIQGFGIFSALQAAKAKGIKVNVQIDGLAASMASFIAMVGDTITIVDFGMIMIHKPRVPGNAAPDAETQKVLDKFEAAAVTIYTARSGKSEAEITSMLEATTWMSAEEAISLGFADAILETELNVAAEVQTIFDSKNVNEIREVMFAESYSPVMHTFAKPKQVLNKNRNMNKIAMTFGLNVEASEEVINAKAQELISENAALKTANAEMKTSITDKDTEIKDLGGKVTESNKAAAVVMIETAITEGKIKEENKESMIVKATADPVMVSELLSGIEAKAATPGTASSKGGNLLDAVNLANGKNGKPGDTDAVPEMTFRKMEKEDSEGLEKIRTEQPEVYAAMYEKEYKVKYENA